MKHDFFLSKGGEMGELTRTFDWSKTSLGTAHTWSQSLLTSVHMMLNSRFPMLIFWGQDLITFYNDAFRPSLGNDGKHPSSLGQPGHISWAESWPVIGPMINNIMQGGDAVWFEDQKLPIYRDGKMDYAYWTYSFSPLMDDSGTISGVLVTCSETTKSVESIVKLADSEERLRLAIESANLGTWHLETETRHFTPSIRLKEIFGYHADDPMPFEAAVEQVTPEYRSIVTDAIEAAISKNEAYDLEYPIIGFHDKKLRWVRATGKVYQSFQDNESYFSGTVTDITEQKQDDERKNDFIAMVSHELKTPLTSLRAYIQLLQKILQKEDGQSLALTEKAINQVNRMTKLITGFLNVSRFESGKISIDKTRFDMADLVKEAEEEARTTINSHTLIFHPVKITYVNADHNKIAQVITNLISNAVKYSPANTEIHVSCETIDQQATVCVKDYGIGIKEEDIPKLFDRYYRVNDGIKAASGFGIGLYLCSEIIKRHNGRLTVKSEVGVGSTFCFTLPVQV